MKSWKIWTSDKRNSLQEKFIVYSWYTLYSNTIRICMLFFLFSFLFGGGSWKYLLAHIVARIRERRRRKKERNNRRRFFLKLYSWAYLIVLEEQMIAQREKKKKETDRKRREKRRPEVKEFLKRMARSCNFHRRRQAQSVIFSISRPFVNLGNPLCV